MRCSCGPRARLVVTIVSETSLASLGPSLSPSVEKSRIGYRFPRYFHSRTANSTGMPTTTIWLAISLTIPSRFTCMGCPVSQDGGYDVLNEYSERSDVVDHHRQEK